MDQDRLSFIINSVGHAFVADPDLTNEPLIHHYLPMTIEEVCQLTSAGCDRSLRLQAVRVLGQYRNKNMANVLIPLLEDPDPGIICETAIALSVIGASSFISPLLQVLTSSSQATSRVAAAYALRSAQDPAIVESLVATLLNLDEDEAVRAQAAESLAHVGDSNVVPILANMTRDASSDVRFWSVYALGLLGGASEIAILNSVALRDYSVVSSGKTVADEARWAISEIVKRNVPV